MTDEVRQVLSGERQWALVCADAMAFLPTLPAGCVDAVVTDPPYGMAYNPSGGDRNAKRGNLPPVIGDDKPFDPTPLLRVVTKIILCGANHYAHLLPPSSCWLVWDKREGTAANDMADCELIWTSLSMPARLFRLRWMGMIRGAERGEKRVHPTQKPVALMRWCLSFLPEGCTVLDPYAGSFTTGVACVQTGRNFIGCEIDPAYCEIGRARLEKASTLWPLFKAEQANLFTAEPKEGT